MPRMLQFGSIGQDVREVQSMLNGQPPTTLAPLVIDGIFGPLTRGRVVEYQRCNGLAPDGIVGPFTRGMLKSKVRLVPASRLLQHYIAAAGPAPLRLFASPRVHLMASFLIPVTPGNSTTFNTTLPPIDATPAMPTLPPLAVQIDGISPDPTPTTLFDWSVEITFDETSCTCGQQGVTFRDGFDQPNVLGGTFSFPWPWIRGGNLTIAARAKVGGDLTEAIFMGTITGTDPAIGNIRTELGDDTMRRIANVESGFHQFEADPGTGGIVPKFNFRPNAQGGRGRGDGGAGICQITPPSAAEIWDWKANVKKGRQILAGARGAALAYLNQHVDDNGQFTNNLGLANADVVLREAVQNYNGGHFWQWNAPANRWEANPPNAYVDLVIRASP